MREQVFIKRNNSIMNEFVGKWCIVKNKIQDTLAVLQFYNLRKAQFPPLIIGMLVFRSSLDVKSSCNQTLLTISRPLMVYVMSFLENGQGKGYDFDIE